MASDTRLSGRPRTRLVATVRARHQPCPLCTYPINQSLPRTGKPHPLSSVVDEWFPRHLGGSVDETNCVETHRICNGIKGKTWPVTPELRARCKAKVEQLLERPTLRTW